MDDEAESFPPSPLPVSSLLQSTRQHFESLISSNSSNDDCSARDRLVKRRKRQMVKQNHKPPAVELEMTAKTSSGEVNPAFSVENRPPERPARSQALSTSSNSSPHRNTIIEAVPRAAHSQAGDADDRSSDGSSLASESVDERRDNDATRCSSLIVFVHKMDQLILEQPNTRPIVIVHTVALETGKYLCSDSRVVPPQSTKSCRLKGNHPTWDQGLVFSFDATSTSGLPADTLLLLFEVVSEPDGAFAKSQALHICWAFLRPVSRIGGVSHLDRPVRLQLYEIPVRRCVRTKFNISHMFAWFQSARKAKYPATLYVTLKTRQMDAENVPLIMSPNEIQGQSLTASPLQRKRLHGQPFKLPTRKVFGCKEVGAMMAAYNADGTLVAVAMTSGDITVYHSSTLASQRQRWRRLQGHRGNVYDLDWAAPGGGGGDDDEAKTDKEKEKVKVLLLLSSGADCTARLWTLDSAWSCLLMSHPSYVYAARFIAATNYMATGCYDQLVRLWRHGATLATASVDLVASYAHHSSPVNSLAFDAHNRQLFSADASGRLLVWQLQESAAQLDVKRWAVWFHPLAITSKFTFHCESCLLVYLFV